MPPRPQGIWQLLLQRYLDLQVHVHLQMKQRVWDFDQGSVWLPRKLADRMQKTKNGSGWPLGFLVKYCSLMLRNRMLADPSFLRSIKKSEKHIPVPFVKRAVFWAEENIDTTLVSSSEVVSLE
ncbi:uncharacterized protein LOC122293898 isoform X2 [Carya illinoinensis]|uniref:uncharacterized protein LOC122293898 isoform X2 n=1 Tax=Carya illinoinensis TaxID=32201 RepID=UPI001C719736|nr:uncharacterized protein LOC122293898 isoform X2 [Carya illinoinensis]